MNSSTKALVILGGAAVVGGVIIMATSKKAQAAPLTDDNEIDQLPEGVPDQVAPPPAQGEPVIAVRQGDIDGTQAPDEPDEVELEVTPVTPEQSRQDAEDQAAEEAQADEDEEAEESDVPEVVQDVIDAIPQNVRNLPSEVQAALPSGEDLQAQAQATADAVVANLPQPEPEEVAEAEDAAEQAEATGEADPEDVPDDTIELVQLMLSEESGHNWKRRIPELAAWQRSRGLTADQKFGPGTASKMAEEIGTLPIIRFWPSSAWDKDKAVSDYRKRLIGIAQSAPPGRATALRSSAMREMGQAYARNPGPISPLVTLELG